MDTKSLNKIKKNLKTTKSGKLAYESKLRNIDNVIKNTEDGFKNEIEKFKKKTSAITSKINKELNSYFDDFEKKFNSLKQEVEINNNNVTVIRTDLTKSFAECSEKWVSKNSQELARMNRDIRDLSDNIILCNNRILAESFSLSERISAIENFLSNNFEYQKKY